MKKARKRPAGKVRVVKVKLPPDAVVQIVPAPAVIPVVALIKDNLVEVVAAKKPPPEKPQTWRQYLFGDL